MPQITYDRNGNSDPISVDAAFIAYPYSQLANCKMVWDDEATGESFCLDLSIRNQIERLQPLKIRGGDDHVYTVTGVQDPTPGLEVHYFGVSQRLGGDGNKPLKGVISSQGKMLVTYASGDVHFNYQAQIIDQNNVFAGPPDY